MISRSSFVHRRDDADNATIDMAPLIDMIFILLIFYIVTTSFIQEAGITIDRPHSAAAQQIDQSFLPLAIAKNGSLHLQGHALAADNTHQLRHAMTEMAVSRVVIQADRDVTTARLLEVMDLCKAAGAEQVNVAAIAH